MRLFSTPMSYAASAFIILGLIWLGIQLKDGMKGGGGEAVKALAMIAAGGVVLAFALAYS